MIVGIYMHVKHHVEYLDTMFIISILLWVDYLFIFLVNNKLYLRQMMILIMFLTSLQLSFQCSHLGSSVMKFIMMHRHLYMLNFLQSLFEILLITREVGFPIGRIHSRSSNLGEAYLLRILLNKVRGPNSFE
uniref:Uncharacterized protein n=1 Tax=Lactuca sativa TaxID=4236 RepID=A0A9R1W1H5_LACSA|nr:hypothetical protein LSAT_V11C400170040 [Lactuca sativa]